MLNPVNEKNVRRLGVVALKAPGKMGGSKEKLGSKFSANRILAITSLPKHMTACVAHRRLHSRAVSSLTGNSRAVY